jgi:Protein of unknown function (DUF3562)
MSAIRKILVPIKELKSRPLPTVVKPAQLARAYGASLELQSRDSQIPTHEASDIASLARETNMPLAAVQEIYKVERARLDQVAKIKIYIPMLIRRRVKDHLRSQQHGSSFLSAMRATSQGQTRQTT